MTRKRKGQRFTLLLYQRAMDRLWKTTLILGLLLAGLWWQAPAGWVIPIPAAYEGWVFVAAVVVLAFTLFALLARRMTYVQARHDHLRLITPFLRLKISYRRVRSVHPAEFHQLYPPGAMNWSERRFLEPFIGETVVVVELFDYPLPPTVLRFFLAPQIFHPQTVGLVLLVANWMQLSTEIDSFLAQWRAAGAG